MKKMSGRFFEGTLGILFILAAIIGLASAVGIGWLIILGIRYLSSLI